jgi:hypothetical protein
MMFGEEVSSPKIIDWIGTKNLKIYFFAFLKLSYLNINSFMWMLLYYTRSIYSQANRELIKIPTTLPLLLQPHTLSAIIDLYETRSTTLVPEYNNIILSLTTPPPLYTRGFRARAFTFNIVWLAQQPTESACVSVQAARHPSVDACSTINHSCTHESCNNCPSVIRVTTQSSHTLPSTSQYYLSINLQTVINDGQLLIGMVRKC